MTTTPTTPFTSQLNNNRVTNKTVSHESMRTIKTIFNVYDLKVVVETSFAESWGKFYRSTITHYQQDLLLTNHTVGRMKAHTQSRENSEFIYASEYVTRFNWNTLEQSHNNALLVAQSTIAKITNDYVTQLFNDVKDALLVRYFNEPVINNTTIPYPLFKVSA
jgi:hypothetical protein